MFPSLGFFKSIPCPERETCERVPCPFSHKQGQLAIPKLEIALQQPALPPPASAPRQQGTSSVLPTKRPVPVSPPKSTPSPVSRSQQEPPRKLQKLAIQNRTFPVASSSTNTDSGLPTLRVNAAQSHVPVPVRQAMLKTLYEHFKTLYEHIHSSYPGLAADHALKQEEELHKKSSKQTYRVAVIQCAAALKRREKPTVFSHPSVGTEDELKAKEEEKKSLQSLQLSRVLLEPLIHSVADLERWGYIVDVPPGPGGHEPSLEMKMSKCERCGQPFQVKRMEAADECTFHWGKPLTTRINGEKIRMYTCCSRAITETEGCVQGPHVFYESGVEDLHARHPFSFLRPAEENDVGLDVAAMDCEMIYTTGGMRVARVSIVDGSGKEVFDEFIRMDDGVHVIDYNTRFSGITKENHSTALLPLASARETLKSLLSTETVLLGHALDNDLKTMRMIHHKCIDTAILFPHRAGPPYRRSLKDLVREKLGKFIQTGTGDLTIGHSSLEDASATLDLVRWHILHERSLQQTDPSSSAKP